MKKWILLLVTLVATGGLCQAQSPIKYQGEYDLGYGFGTGTFALNRASLHTIQGLKVGRHFSAGVGVGLDLYHASGYDPDLFIPIYLNVKGYLPIVPKIAPYLSFDIGGGIGASRYAQGLSGLVITPALGIKIGPVKAQIGFHQQKISQSGISVNFNSVQIKAGVIF